MNTILLATLTGALTAVCWGTADWLSAKASKVHKKFEINFAFQLPSVIIMIPILLIVKQPLPNNSQIVVLALISALYTGAYLMLLKALSMGSVGIVVPLANIFALVTLILSTIFLGIAFASLQIMAIVGIVLGAFLLAYEKNSNKVPMHKLHRASIFALTAAVVWGVAFFLVDTIIGDVTWQMLTGITSTFMVLMAFGLLVFNSKGMVKKSIKSALKIRIGLYGGIIAQVGAISLYFGSQRAGSVVIPAVMASTAPLVASLLSALYDKEKIGLVKRIGAVVVVAGIIILNLV